MAAAKTFWTSFLDGLTGEGIFGDLRIPGTPARLFKEDPKEITHPTGMLVPGLAGNVSVVGVGKAPSGFFGGGYDVDEMLGLVPKMDIQMEIVQVDGVYVDVNGEKVNIARDREKGWVVVSEPTTRAAR